MLLRSSYVLDYKRGRKACKIDAVLAELNRVFRQAGVRWSVEITQEPGDAIRLAAQMAEQGAPVVTVYGGDGTISEIACELAGTQTALGSRGHPG